MHPSLNSTTKFLSLSLLTLVSCNKEIKVTQEENKKPNILFAISDDQSFPYASAYGNETVNTPAFDRVARQGVLFTNAFVASPGCSPSRAAILTGRNCWQLEQAGTHASSFPAKYTVFPDILENHGYYVGYTRKGWAPGNWKISGRKRNPAGNAFNGHKLKPPYNGIVSDDYTSNFKEFLDSVPDNSPFCFWYGASEPHRSFEEGSGHKDGKKNSQAYLPGFLPDSDTVLSDILDYAVEIEWFDKHLGQMLDILEERGELDNTIVVVTSDNGMSFPRAKANVYEYGIHVPLAIMWGDQIKGNRVVNDLISLIDLAPTFLEAAGAEHPDGEKSELSMEGKSLMNILMNDKQGIVDPERDMVMASRERHSSSRWNNLTYPQRALRTRQYLYIRNFKPERWPAGAPQKYLEDGTLGPEHRAYHDIDACPTLLYLEDNRTNLYVKKYFDLAVGKRPGEELYNVEEDPFCLTNLANDSGYRNILQTHREKMGSYLMKTQDPRVTGNGDIWESYIRYSPIRRFPEPGWLKDMVKPLEK